MTELPTLQQENKLSGVGLWGPWDVSLGHWQGPLINVVTSKPRVSAIKIHQLDLYKSIAKHWIINGASEEQQRTPCPGGFARAAAPAWRALAMPTSPLLCWGQGHCRHRAQPGSGLSLALTA